MTLPLADPTEDHASAPEGRLLTISDMARRHGVSLRTLRFYEARRLLAPLRVGSGRLYGPADCRRLETILKGKKLGFTLSEIADMVGKGEPSGAVLTLGAAQVASQIEHLERQRHGLDEAIRELQSTHARLLHASA